jgi:hypothetical protein
MKMSRPYLLRDNTLTRGLSISSLFGLLLVLLLGCTESSKESDEPERDRGLWVDAGRDAYIVGQRDGGMGSGSGDMLILPDATPKRCLKEEVPLVELAASELIPGAKSLYGRYEHNGDTIREIVVGSHNADNNIFRIYGGLPLQQLGEIVVTGETKAIFMGGHLTRRQVSQPIRFGENTAVFTTQIGSNTAVIRFFDSQDFTDIGIFELDRPVQNIHVLPTGDMPIILANFVDGSCLVKGIVASEPILERGQCRVKVGYDANQDGVSEVLRYGQAGLALIDAVVGDEIALEADIHAHAVGFTDDYLVTAKRDGQTLRINYHDRIDLNTIQGEQTNIANGADFVRLQFHHNPDEFRLIAQFEKTGLQYLRVFEPGETLRRVAEFGPHRVLDWLIEADADGDGKEELKVMGGSEEDGYNTKLDYRSLRNGSTTFEIGALRNIRFQPIWTNDIPGTVTNLDGCEGLDRVLLRQTRRDEMGVRSTRTLFQDDEGTENYRSDTFTGRTHELVIMDLNGEAPAELVELRQANAESSVLRVFGASSTTAGSMPPNDMGTTD